MSCARNGSTHRVLDSDGPSLLVGLDADLKLRLVTLALHMWPWVTGAGEVRENLVSN